MPRQQSIPIPLEPYLRLPEEKALVLLTSTLGCSISWLTTRFIASSLGDNERSNGSDVELPVTCVILVSWLRDSAFWKTELKRATGLDASRLSSSNRFVFVDALSQPRPLTDILHSISASIEALEQHHGRNDTVSPRILLVLDDPDVCLATAAATASELTTFLLSARRQTWAAVLTCNAGFPLTRAATATPDTRFTPIELETAAFVAGQAHGADVVLSVRELDTGAARDVSGVLRITRGGNAYRLGDESGQHHDAIRETELLYLVQRDGNVKAFARGSNVDAY